MGRMRRCLGPVAFRRCPGWLRLLWKYVLPEGEMSKRRRGNLLILPAQAHQLLVMGCIFWLEMLKHTFTIFIHAIIYDRVCNHVSSGIISSNAIFYIRLFCMDGYGVITNRRNNYRPPCWLPALLNQSLDECLEKICLEEK